MDEGWTIDQKKGQRASRPRRSNEGDRTGKKKERGKINNKQEPRGSPTKEEKKRQSKESEGEEKRRKRERVREREEKKMIGVGWTNEALPRNYQCCWFEVNEMKEEGSWANHCLGKVM